MKIFFVFFSIFGALSPGTMGTMGKSAWPCPTARDRGSCVYGLVIPSRNTHRRSRRSVTSWLSRAYERTIVKKKRQHYTF